MAARPNFIDLGSQNQSLLHTSTPSPRDGPSLPLSGHAPPALSPLDAFALQSRMLAHKLEQGRRHDPRMSRLPHTVISEELAKPRPGYEEIAPSPSSDGFQSAARKYSPQIDVTPTSPNVLESGLKHRSYYPSVQAFDDAVSMLSEKSVSVEQRSSSPANLEEPVIAKDYFSSWRSSSPGLFHNGDKNVKNSDATARLNVLHSPAAGSHSRTPTPNRWEEFTASQSPGNMNSLQDRLSIRPVLLDNDGDLKLTSSTGVGTDLQSKPRKPSTYGDRSRSRSPLPPFLAAPRSPSVSSTYSIEAATVNFSRPLSSHSHTSISKKTSFEGSTPQINTSEPGNSLFSMPSRAGVRIALSPLRTDVTAMQTGPIDNVPTKPFSSKFPYAAPSYKLPRFSLFRGRKGNSSKAHEVEQQDAATPSGEATKSGKLTEDGMILAVQDSAIQLVEPTSINRNPPQPLQSVRRSSADDFPAYHFPKAHRSNPSLPNLATNSIPSLTSAHQINLALRTPTSPFSLSPGSPQPSTPMDPEAHLAKGIALHESGALQKSTYHLRLAARAGLPTGMLLYALACRHGWGMRANQAEGVAWLRKAVEGAGSEVANDQHEAAAQTLPSTAAVAGKAHKAQFALSIYELGVSYMNGWGVARDRGLGVRCFEIAGAWGDADALAEAGECYARGVGCRKDLRRAAGLLREAERRGVEGVGWSWIYKEKYMPVASSFSSPSSSTSSPAVADAVAGPQYGVAGEKREKSKSRTRALFGGGHGGGGGGVVNP